MAESVILTNMCMIYDGEGNVLVQNTVKPYWSGITFPGGHVDPGESFTDAVIREVFEETGLTVWDVQLCGIEDWFRDDGTRYVVLLYKTKHFTGELRSSDEGEVFWVKMEDFPNQRLVSGMDEMFRVFTEDSLSERFFVKENGKYRSVLK